MTLSRWRAPFAGGIVAQIKSNREFLARDVSVIVPVRNNPSGIADLILSFRQSPNSEIRELIIVDDGSEPPLQLSTGYTGQPSIRITRISPQGPAAARNRGAELASGQWLLFIDSDCVVTETLLMAYRSAMTGAVGYAGNVRAQKEGSLSRFYDAHNILIPFGVAESGIPQHVVTANALIWRQAFDLIGGFDENFKLAAGEDVDLGLRLRNVGELRFVSDAIVKHDYGGPLQFWKRFWRYGRANAMLEKKYGESFRPHRKPAIHSGVLTALLSFLQHWILLSGYEFEGKIS